MTINKNLLVGMLLLGVMSHYDKEEVVKDKDLNYIAATLKKKHWSLKHGTPKMIMQPAKHIAEFKLLHENWLSHARLADNAWKNTEQTLKIEITTTALLMALLRKEPKAKKYYGFNTNKLSKYVNNSAHKDNYLFTSSKVATALLENLDLEIEKYKETV